MRGVLTRWPRQTITSNSDQLNFVSFSIPKINFLSFDLDDQFLSRQTEISIAGDGNLMMVVCVCVFFDLHHTKSSPKDLSHLKQDQIFVYMRDGAVGVI